MDKITFTLAEIKKHGPCADGWKKLCKSLGDIRKYGKNTPITISQIIESNGLQDALWALRSTPEDTHYLWRHFAVDCAERVKHLMADARSLNALEVARKHADGNASDDELTDAKAAAGNAVWAATWAATRAAAAVGDAFWAAAWAAAAAGDAEKEFQTNLLKEYCLTGKRVITEEK